VKPGVFRLVLLALAASLPLLAQTGLATITGTVTDQTGAVMVGVTVTATQVATGATVSAATSETGNYTIPQLRVGEYEVVIEQPGFKVFRRSGITLSAAQILRLDVQLEVGATTESVTVTAEATLLKTDSSTLSTNITPRQIQNLPILPVGTFFIRDPFAVGQSVPGLVWTNQGFGVSRVNGLPGAGVQYRLDGEILGQLAAPTITTRTQPSPDAIEEVAVQTSNVTAEFGSASGAVFNVSIKSGTNQFHGTAYDYHVNEVLNAADSGTHIRNRIRKYDYGFNIGGPIKLPKLYDGVNKSFFFFNWEQLRDKQVSIASSIPTVPTEAYRRGDFSGLFAASGNANLRLNAAGGIPAHDYRDPLGNTVALGTIFDPRSTTQVTCNPSLSQDCQPGTTLNYRAPFPGNLIPASLFDPVSTAVLNKYIPLPNLPSLINNYRVPIATSRITSSPALKLDQNLGSRGRVSFTWNRNKTTSPVQTLGNLAEGFPEPFSNNQGTYETSDSYRLNLDYTLTPTMNYHLGLGYNVWEFTNNPLTLNYNALADIGLRGATVNRTAPRFNLGAQTTPATGGMNNIGNAGNSVQPERRPSITMTLTWVKGNHTIKGGADFRQDMIPFINYAGTNGIYGFTGNGVTWQPSLLGVTGFQGNSNVGFTFANYLMGSVRAVTLGVPVSYRRSKQQWGLFLQDTWRARRNLTVDYGLRWDYGTYTREDYGRLGAFSATVPNTAAGGHPGGLIYEATCQCRFADNYPYAVGPRLGVAYTINEKTVIRGGFSIAYGSIGTVGGTAVSTANFGDVQDGEQAFNLRDGIPSSVQPQWPVFDSGQGLTPGTVGTAPTLVDPNAGRPDRTYQWNVSLQREITRNMVIEAAYVGNRNVWQPATGFQDFNAVSEQLLAQYGFTVGNLADAAILQQRIDRLTTAQRSTLASRGVFLPYSNFPASGAAAQTVFQSIRPYPQYNTGIAPSAPLGKIWYDALQISINKRYSSGLQVTANYTFSKNLQHISAFDVFNRANGKDLVPGNPPHILRVLFLYQIPKPADSLPVLGNRIVSWAVRDWGISMAMTYQTGAYLGRPNAGSVNPISQWLGRGPGGAQLKKNSDGTYMSPWAVNWKDLDGKIHPEPLDINCKCFDPNTTVVLNPAAWETVPDGVWAAQTQILPFFRASRRPSESANLARNFRFGPDGRYALQIRVEFQNVFNRRFLPNPILGNFNAAPTPVLGSRNPVTGAIATAYTAGFGTFGNLSNANQFGAPRSGQFIGRFTF
jgi:hypothetical protein